MRLRATRLTAIAHAARGGPSVVWGPPVVISAGGTYSGNWRSLNPAVPAVTIATADPVLLQDFRVESAGECFRFGVVGNVKLTLLNGTGRGLNPNAAGQAAGRFLNDVGCTHTLEVLRCTIANTGGIYVNGGGSTNLQKLVVRGNKFLNVDGRKSDGAGGYQAVPPEVYQAVQVNGFHQIPELDIDWNYIQNDPGRSAVEDVINMYLSGGVVGRPARIYNNCIRGAYPRDPVAAGYSGGGIIVDGDATGAADASRYNDIQFNVVVGTTNYGIALAAGMDGTVSNNRVLSSGRLPRDGQLLASANVGVYIWDFYGDTAVGAFANNGGANNYVGCVNAAGARNDTWTPDGVLTGTTAHAGAIGTATEEAEVAAWHAARLLAGQALGSTLSSPGMTPNAPGAGAVVAVGALLEGETLTADVSGLADSDGLGAFGYQWLRDGAAIGGATSSAYVLQPADGGADIAVRVTWTDGNLCLESLTSAEVGPVVPLAPPDGQQDYTEAGRYVPLYAIGV